MGCSKSRRVAAEGARPARRRGQGAAIADVDVPASSLALGGEPPLPGMVPGSAEAEAEPEPEPEPEPTFKGPKPDPKVQASLEGRKRLMQMRRKKEVLRLVPLHLSVLEKAEPECGWTEAVISLYRHVLPSLGRSHIDGIIRAERTDTLLFVRSARAKHDGVADEDDAPGGPGTRDVSDSDSGTSSFSDSDAEEESDSDEDEDEDDDEEGAAEPEIEDVDDLLLKPQNPDGSLTAKARIIGAITWEPVPNAIKPRCRLLQLTLIGCRTKYQGYGIASRLMRECKDPLVVRLDYDVITTFADHNAVPFFGALSLPAPAQTLCTAAVCKCLCAQNVCTASAEVARVCSQQSTASTTTRS